MFQSSKTALLEMITDLKTAFSEMLWETDWMDYATKIRALEKLAAMLPLVAYPEFLFDDARLDWEYQDVSLLFPLSDQERDFSFELSRGRPFRE